ncbi:carbonate dehydratase [Thiohalorhabdus denitrificans]|uniref:ATPase, P-type (Transporting), HAD superfamily, subfamily IC n=1 Tax=Thiohalorhabdus denitrificans TaxID=381306 RepID=A0A0P9CNJ5_9GAMM|nr:cation-transporting P-type ATPase [Thiohalorhabdus denitrificans]KPV40682.1 carbonate dehydratase [Thiohalorhabdus denitrificans]SCY47060.1 ATPase, P-type (transporting), HAD superfamily, subfamily IC [Thiohalorhabdus denitrificans]
MANAENAWHARRVEEVLRDLETSPEGLDSGTARSRFQEHGPNRIPEQESAGAVLRFLRQFHNLFIYILIVAAVGTAFLGKGVDTGVILGVVLINAVIGFFQEGKAERALDAIRGMLSPRAQVLRDGRQQTLPAEQVVPGDVLLLGAGDRVAADLRLVRAHNLRVDEAVLTGESEPVEKGTAPVAPEAELADRAGMAYSGTLVAAGQGRGVVVATGGRTQIGRISRMVSQVESVQTPLLRQVGRFARHLSVAILVLAAFTFAFGLVVRGYSGPDMFMAAVSLAVAAIPEGLPAIMTITLAIGVQRMAGRNAIIRRLPAVETLGAVTTICSDKTGTLTRNEMTVKSLVTADGEVEVGGVGYAPHGSFTRDGGDVDPYTEPVLAEALRAGLLCNDAWLHEGEDGWWPEGDPTETALVTVALKAGMDQRQVNERYPRDDVIPFDSAHNFMATLHHDHEGHGYIYVKGAPERVLELCTRERATGGDRPLDAAAWHRRMDEIAGQGQRLLAIAAGHASPEKSLLEFDNVEAGGLTLLAVVGLIDPPRDEAIRSVAACRGAGIRVKMITGDHAVTARAIAGQLGLNARDAVAGRQIEESDDDRLRDMVREVDVFARASPRHKLRLVQALQANGEVVAMTGDGVNDSPALKRADIGVAMGMKGTEASKEASEMVLADDNFASIASAVEEGRTVYDNLQKAILFLLPTNGGQAFTIVTAILLGVTLPVTPVQALWVNMVTAVTLALALAFEPTEPGVMQRRPRPADAPLLSGFLIWRVGFVSVLLVAGTFGHFLWMELHGAGKEVERTVAINTLVMGQVFYLFNSRFILEPVVTRQGLQGGRAVLVAVAVLVVLQGLFTYSTPFQYLFGTAPIGGQDWARILAFGVALFLLVEGEKALLRGRVRR